MARCFVTRRLPGKALDRLAAEHELDLWSAGRPPDRDELLAHAPEAEGLLSQLTARPDRRHERPGPRPEPGLDRRRGPRRDRPRAAADRAPAAAVPQPDDRTPHRLGDPPG